MSATRASRPRPRAWRASSTSCRRPPRRAELLALIDQLNKDPKVNGILCQLPVPKQIDPQAIIDAIDPAKDVDGFHVFNAGPFSRPAARASSPARPMAACCC